MPIRHNNAVKDRIIRLIRDTLVVDPLATNIQIAEIISKKLNRVVDEHFISKMRRRARGAIMYDVDEKSVKMRIAEMREHFRVGIKKLYEIAFYDPEKIPPGQRPPTYRDQIMAIRGIAILNKTMFDEEIDSRIFDKQIALLEAERRNLPLSEETLAQIEQVFNNWGFAPFAMRDAEFTQQKKLDAKPNDTTPPSAPGTAANA